MTSTESDGRGSEGREEVRKWESNLLVFLPSPSPTSKLLKQKLFREVRSALRAAKYCKRRACLQNLENESLMQLSKNGAGITGTGGAHRHPVTDFAASSDCAPLVSSVKVARHMRAVFSVFGRGKLWTTLRLAENHEPRRTRSTTTNSTQLIRSIVGDTMER